MIHLFAALVFVPSALAAEASEISRDGAYWDWQLTEPFDLSVDVEVLDLDPDSVSRAQVADLNSRGIKTICYVSVGTVESYRDDAHRFPESVQGDVYDDWPNERYLDIRNREVVVPLMTKRFDRCKALGFDAIEPDNMDLFETDTGINITMQDQANYLVELVAYAHVIGLEIGQKNAPELIAYMHDRFDFLILESCFYYDFCDDAEPYLRTGKDVLAAEYAHKRIDEKMACAYAAETGVKFIFKERELAAGGRAC